MQDTTAEPALKENEPNNATRAIKRAFITFQESDQTRPNSVGEGKSRGVLQNVSNSLDLNRVAASDPCPKQKPAPRSRTGAFDLNAADGVSTSVRKTHQRSEIPKPLAISGTPKDPLTLWKEMKENGFLSSSHAGLTFHGAVTPSSHGGIPVPMRTDPKPMRKKETPRKENMSRVGHVSAPTGLLSGLNPGIINHVRNKRQVHSIINSLVRSQQNEDTRDQTKAEEIEKHATDVSNENPAVSFLSLKAANTASQWLDLLNQDIKGRLSALRKTRKRVSSILTTELPSLSSSELCSSEESNANSHFVKWGKMFHQIGTSLEEEERHLENWLQNVRELQILCDNALETSQFGASESAQKWNESAAKSATELAVRAAAASIYSTCNFIKSKENEY